MPLRAQIIKIRQPIQPDDHKLLQRDLPVLVLVHLRQHGLDDGVRLLLVLDVVLGLLLRVDVVHAVDGLYLGAAPDAVAGEGGSTRLVRWQCGEAGYGDAPVEIMQLEETGEVEGVAGRGLDWLVVFRRGIAHIWCSLDI